MNRRKLFSYLPILILLTLFSKPVFSEEVRIVKPLPTLSIDQDTLEYLYGKAKALSGIEDFDIKKLPPIYVVSKDMMATIVCPLKPHECDRLAAVFDDIEYRILILDSFEISSNFKPFDYSFLIHEIIHALQYLKNGPEIFKDCDAIFRTESEAYSAQDQYLKNEGQFFRASIALKFFYCDEEQASNDYSESLTLWQEREKKDLH